MSEKEKVKKPLWQWSASELTAAIRENNIYCEDVVESVISRIKTVNPGLNAVVVDMSDQALRQAREADETVRNGYEIGPLHGVPITVKINVDVKGQPNSAGIKTMANVIATEDAPVVKNIKEAGAIIIGLTNMPDFGTRWQTDNDLHGLTKNPWNADITCGGSSGGAGVALAAGIGPIAHGNDIGGSLRMPAYCCGVSAIRPTMGRVPNYNHSRSSQGIESEMVSNLFYVHGPMAREVRDMRLLLEVMSRGNPNDPWWVPAPLSYSSPGDAVRVAVVRRPINKEPHDAISEGLDRAAQYLAAAGYVVEDAEAPFSQKIGKLWNSLILTELLQPVADEYIKKNGSESLKTFFYNTARYSPRLNLEEYLKAMKERTTIMRQWQCFVKRYPIVLTPFSLSLPYEVDEDLKGEDRVMQMMEDLQTCFSINFLGLPAAVTPIGIHEGIPFGIQIIGQRFREDMVLDAAEVIQQKVGILPQRIWQ